MAGGLVSYRPIDWIDWLPADRYRVGDDGSVLRWFAGAKGKARRRHPPHWKRLPGRGGHRQRRVTLSYGGRCKGFLVSYLVLRAFVGPRPFGCIALHYPDRDPLNDRLDNLRWAPNGAQQFDNPGGHPETLHHNGSENPRACLDEGDIPEIFRLSRAGWTNQDIADEFGVAKATVWAVLNRKTWGHVFVDAMLRPPIVQGQVRGSGVGTSRLVESDIPIIVRMSREGRSRAEIAGEFGVSRPTIGMVLRRQSWKHVDVGPDPSSRVVG